MKELDKLKELAKQVGEASDNTAWSWDGDCGIGRVLEDLSEKMLDLIASLETDKPVEGELLPCPFCGSDDLLIKNRIKIECLDCHCVAVSTTREVESVWNTRPTEQTEQGSEYDK